MNGHIVVFTTAGSKEEANKLSRGLVEEKLAYCVNTVPSIQSTYFWEGKLCVDEELLLVIKTQESKFTAVESWVRKNHSYKIPELIALPIVKGSADYLKCIDDWTR
jgi:periplasmic divalent cation tolerance protein